MIFIIICVAIAIFGLTPLLEIWYDPTVDADLRYMTYYYVGYGVFCLIIYYFIVMPMFNLPGLDLSNIGAITSGSVLMSGGAVGLVSLFLRSASQSTALKTASTTAPA
jgi:hypothetical protein